MKAAAIAAAFSGSRLRRAAADPLTTDQVRRILRHRGLWAPFPDHDEVPHPQRVALESKADILGYGGQAGGGKSDLLLGVAKDHWRGVIFRRVYPSLKSLIDRSRELYNPEQDKAAYDRYNESLHRWRFDTGGVLNFDSLQYEKDALGYQGQPHDFYGFDELTEFTEYQFRFVTGWNRTSRKGQRCRVVAALNPPTDEDGRWVIRYFAPWLDSEYRGTRAKPGELRWFTTIAGRDVEVPNGDPFILKDGKPHYQFDSAKVDPTEVFMPKSRTFVFASVRDNPVLVASGYVATLQAMPEPLRSILLNGDFTIGMEEDPWRVIPSAWVRAAQERWRQNRNVPLKTMAQLGVDVARSAASMGGDRTVFTPRHAHRVPEQKVERTADGPKVVQHIILLKPGQATVTIDVIGVGSSPVDFAKATFKVNAFNGAEGTERMSKEGNLSFVNKRSAAYWYLREQLDPASGMDIELPDDPELLQDLTVFKWSLTPRGIKVESKDDGTSTSVVKRLGRSPDKGDSCVYAFAPPETQKGMAMFDLLKEQYAEHQKKAQEQKDAGWH